MSQIATIIEQSKRLLDAGLDPKSADMYWLGSAATISPDEDEYKLHAKPYYPLYERVTESVNRDREDRDKYGFDNTIEIKAKEDFLSRLFPAWSLSKLWDAFGLDILGGWFSLGSYSSEDMIEELVSMLESRHANH